MLCSLLRLSCRKTSYNVNINKITDKNLCSAHYLDEVTSGLKQVMHQSFVTPATLGPGKCRGLKYRDFVWELRCPSSI